MNPSSVTQPTLEGSPRKKPQLSEHSYQFVQTFSLLQVQTISKSYHIKTTVKLFLFLFFSTVLEAGPLNFRVFQQPLLFTYAGIKVADLMPRRLLFALLLAFSSTGSDSAVLQMRSFPSLQPVAKCPSSAKLQDKTSNTEKSWQILGGKIW